MFYKAALTVTSLMVAGTSSFAQGFTGGQLGIEYNAPVDGGDMGGTTYSLGGEYAISRTFAMALDATSYRLDNVETSVSNFTLHGIYHLNEKMSLGAFVGLDRLTDSRNTLYGVEFGTEVQGGLFNTGPRDISGYIGFADGESSDSMFAGVGGNQRITDSIDLVADINWAQIDDESTWKGTATAEYHMANGPDFYGNLGVVETSDDPDMQIFVGIGARISFGAARGTTFDQRSLLESLPSF